MCSRIGSGEGDESDCLSLKQTDDSVRFFRTHPIYRGLASLWTIGMLTAFSLPPTSVPAVESALSVDKLIHFGLFFGFGLLWMRALRPPSAEGVADGLQGASLRFVGIGVCFAGGAEWYQQVIPVSRTSDPYDALANVVGLLTSLVVYTAFLRWGPAPPSVSSANDAS